MLLGGVAAALASHAAVAPKAKHIDVTQCVSVSAPVTDVWCVTQRGQHGQSAPWQCPAARRLCLLRARLGDHGRPATASDAAASRLQGRSSRRL